MAAVYSSYAKRYGRMNWAAAQVIEKEEREKKALKEKLKAEILAEMEAQTKADSEAEEKETTEE